MSPCNDHNITCNNYYEFVSLTPYNDNTCLVKAKMVNNENNEILDNNGSPERQNAQNTYLTINDN